MGSISLKREFIVFVLSLFLVADTIAQQEKSRKLSVALNTGVTNSRIKSFTPPGVTELNLPDKTQKLSLGYYYGISIEYLLNSRYLISLGLHSTANKIHYTIPDVSFQREDSIWVDANGDIKNIPQMVSPQYRGQLVFIRGDWQRIFSSL